MEGSCWILDRTLQSVGLLGWTTASIVLILLCCCCVCAPEMHLRPGCCARADPSLLILVPPSISKPPSISLSRWPSVRPVVLPPPSLSCLHPASSVLSPRRCTLRSGPTRSHAAPPITICEAQHPRHASIWKPCPTARSLGLQAKHEHTVLTQCQVPTACLSLLCLLHLPPCFQAAAIAAAAIDLALGDGCACAACWSSCSAAVCCSSRCGDFCVPCDAATQCCFARKNGPETQVEYF